MYEMEGLPWLRIVPRRSIARSSRLCGADHPLGRPTANLWPLGVRVAEGLLRTELPSLVMCRDV
jgi:hypothetical protein